jgi:hypothetical protein
MLLKLHQRIRVETSIQILDDTFLDYNWIVSQNVLSKITTFSLVEFQSFFELCHITFEPIFCFFENGWVKFDGFTVGQVITKWIKIHFNFGSALFQIIDVKLKISNLFLELDHHSIGLLILFLLFKESHIHVFWEHGKVLHFFLFLLENFWLIVLLVLELLVHSKRLHFCDSFTVFDFLWMTLHLQKNTSLHVFILVG